METKKQKIERLKARIKERKEQDLIITHPILKGWNNESIAELEQQLKELENKNGMD